MKEEKTGVSNWLGDRVSDGAAVILKPVGEALGEGARAVFEAVMHSLPPIFVIGGLVCFLLTIAVGKHKPFFWGLAFWALSAIIRGFNIEAGI